MGVQGNIFDRRGPEVECLHPHQPCTFISHMTPVAPPNPFMGVPCDVAIE